MRAVVYTEFQGPLLIEQVAEPAVSDDGVVIEVRAAGLCRSDWHGWMGHDADIRLPHVPGHEFAGIIVARGRRVTRWREGDRVTVPFSVGCGTCPQCDSGNHQICDRYFQPGFTAWGSFAERIAIPYADVNLVRLPDSLSFVDAASLGCRFVTAYRAVTDQGQLRAGQWLAVFGCGGVGLSALMIGTVKGANTIGVDVHPEALRMASQVGAQHVINATDIADPVAEIVERTDGGAHVAIDALGSSATCDQSIRSLRKQGRHVQVGLFPGAGQSPRVPMGIVISRELQIVGSHGMSAQAYDPMLDMIVDGRLQPQQLVTQTVSLERVPELLPTMASNPRGGTTVVCF